MDDEEVGTEESLEIEEQGYEEGQEEEEDLLVSAEGEEAPPTEQQEEEEEAPEPVKARPPISTASSRLDRLKENVDPAIFDDLMGYVEERIQHATQTATYANVQAAQAASQMPNLFKVHGPQLQQYIGELSPEIKTSPKAVQIAVARLLIESEDDIPATLARLSKLAGSAPASKKTGTASSAPPASQRVPSGGNSAGATRSPATVAGRLDRDIKTMMEMYGLTKAEALAEIRESGR